MSIGVVGRLAVSSRTKIFISYRREDAEDEANALQRGILEHSSHKDVFLESFEPGDRLSASIRKEIDESAAFLCVIGPRWNFDGKVAKRDDWVGYEVQLALESDDVTIIPILVRGARMPDPKTLPFAIRGLTDRVGIEMSTIAGQSLDRLIQKLNKVCPSARRLTRFEQRRRQIKRVVIGLVAPVMASALTLQVYRCSAPGPVTVCVGSVRSMKVSRRGEATMGIDIKFSFGTAATWVLETRHGLHEGANLDIGRQFIIRENGGITDEACIEIRPREDLLVPLDVRIAGRQEEPVDPSPRIRWSLIEKLKDKRRDLWTFKFTKAGWTIEIVVNVRLAD